MIAKFNAGIKKMDHTGLFSFEVKILFTDNLECSANTFTFDMELEYSVLRKVCITLLKQLAICKMDQSISHMYFYKRIIPFGMN